MALRDYIPFLSKADSAPRNLGSVFPIVIDTDRSTLTFQSVVFDIPKLQKEGYGNPIAKRCIDLKATAVASVPVNLRCSENLGDKNARFAPFMEEIQSKVETMIKQFQVFGVAFAHIVVTPRKVDLVVLPAVAIEADVDKKTGKLKSIKAIEAPETNEGVLFGEGSNRSIDSCFFMIDSGAKGNPYEAESVVKTLSSTINAHNLTISWLENYLESGATFGAYISPDNSGSHVNNTLTKESIIGNNEKESFKQLHEEKGGVKGAGQNVLWSVPIKVHNLGGSAREAQIKDVGDQLGGYIATGIGVPSQLASIKGSQTYANQGEAKNAFYSMTVLPLANMFWDGLSKATARAIKTGVKSFRDQKVTVTFKPDVMKIPHIREELQQEFQRINTLNFMTANEKRDEKNRIMGLIAGETGFLPEREDGDKLPDNEPVAESEGGSGVVNESTLQQIKDDIIDEIKKERDQS